MVHVYDQAVERRPAFGLRVPTRQHDGIAVECMREMRLCKRDKILMLRSLEERLTEYQGNTVAAVADGPLVDSV